MQEVIGGRESSINLVQPVLTDFFPLVQVNNKIYFCFFEDFLSTGGQNSAILVTKMLRDKQLNKSFVDSIASSVSVSHTKVEAPF